jgi:allantoinase
MSIASNHSSTESTQGRRWALHGRRVVSPQEVEESWVVVRGELIEEVRSTPPQDMEIISVGDAVVMPGLVDSHVHINEPGRTEWEGFFTATQAALAGGVTTVVDMPLNCLPVTTTEEALEVKLQALGDQLHVDVGFWGGVVPDHRDQLSALVARGALGCKAFMVHSGIDEFPASDEGVLREALATLKRVGAPLLVHAELEADVERSCHDPTAYQSYLESRPSSWEVEAIAQVISLLRAHGGQAHIVHLSAADALPMIAQAKRDGLSLTVETCPHYLCLSAEEIAPKQTHFKCAPPIRQEENRARLWAGLREGIIDFVVSDHSPCTPQLKRLDTGDFHDAWGGISSLQLGLPNVWTEAQARGFSLLDLTAWLAERPAQLAGIDDRKGAILPGREADFVIWDPEASFLLQPEDLRFKHRLSPYLGRQLQGRVLQTYLRGQLAFDHGTILGALGQSILHRRPRG